MTSFAIIYHVACKRVHHFLIDAGSFIIVFRYDPGPAVYYEATFCVNNAHNNFLSIFFAAKCGDARFVGTLQFIMRSENSGDPCYESKTINDVGKMIAFV